jgi:hypothetical protein
MAIRFCGLLVGLFAVGIALTFMVQAWDRPLSEAQFPDPQGGKYLHL